jgi:hypothetical protein
MMALKVCTRPGLEALALTWRQRLTTLPKGPSRGAAALRAEAAACCISALLCQGGSVPAADVPALPLLLSAVYWVGCGLAIAQPATHSTANDASR